MSDTRGQKNAWDALREENERLKSALDEARGVLRDIADATTFDPIQWRMWCRAALATGRLSEVEPFPGSVMVNLGAVVDIASGKGEP